MPYAFSDGETAKQMVFSIDYEHRVNFVLVQYLFYFSNLRIRCHRLWGACHDVGYAEVEETVLRVLHGAAYVAVGNDAAHDAFLFCHAETKAAVAHVDHSLAKLHCGRDYGQVFRAHHVACLRQEAFAE